MNDEQKRMLDSIEWREHTHGNGCVDVTGSVKLTALHNVGVFISMNEAKHAIRHCLIAECEKVSGNYINHDDKVELLDAISSIDDAIRMHSGGLLEEKGTETGKAWITIKNFIKGRL